MEKLILRASYSPYYERFTECFFNIYIEERNDLPYVLMPEILYGEEDVGLNLEIEMNDVDTNETDRALTRAILEVGHGTFSATKEYGIISSFFF